MPPRSAATSPISACRPIFATSTVVGGTRASTRGCAWSTPLRPDTTPTGGTYTPSQPLTVQSGLTAQNEYEIRELWLVRNGERTDVILGRQFIPDLGGHQDRRPAGRLRELADVHAISGSAGLYPVRGSRSITTDYVDLKNERRRPSRDVASAPAGSAPRIARSNAYGSFGGVVLDPLQDERSAAFLRHVDRLLALRLAARLLPLRRSSTCSARRMRPEHGSRTSRAGVNYKPNPRLRLTASFNRVDTDTLNVQANAFLSQPQAGVSVIQNDVYVPRLATQQLRGSISAGLGPARSGTRSRSRRRIAAVPGSTSGRPTG